MSPDLVLYTAAGAIGLSVVLLVLALVMGSAQPTGVAKSLAVIDQMRAQREVAKHELPFKERILFPAVDAFKALGNRLSPAGTAARLQKNLDFAGNPPGWTVDRLLGVKGAGLVGGALLAWLIGGLGIRGILFAVVGGAAGFWLPDLLIYNKGLHRQELIRRSLPDALDMLTVCVEAGLGFDAAMLQVSRNTNGPISGEFSRVLQEIQIGKTRADAFQDLATRTNVDELRTFVAAIVQADRLGIPIANVLREQSKEMRLIRRQRAEEKAQKVPVKILFPLIFCIFPALFVVIIGPGVIRMIEAFSGTL
ncbi:MAG: type II secretion system F family protein [Actinomycetota bacterium]